MKFKVSENRTIAIGKLMDLLGISVGDEIEIVETNVKNKTATIKKKEGK